MARSVGRNAIISENIGREQFRRKGARCEWSCAMARSERRERLIMDWSSPPAPNPDPLGRKINSAWLALVNRFDHRSGCETRNANHATDS